MNRNFPTAGAKDPKDVLSPLKIWGYSAFHDTHEDTQMALQRKLKQIEERPNGVLRFSRRFPKAVAEFLKQPTLQIHIRSS